MSESTPQAARRTRGRRPGGSAVEEILAAARAEFGERGYSAASVRGVARRAGVDPGLVRYYFGGGKAQLFAGAWARRDDVDPATLLTGLLDDGLDDLGSRLLDAVLRTWDAPGGPERFRMVVAATASGEDHLVRDFLQSEIFGRIRAHLETPDADLRVGLVATHLVGVLVSRHVLEIEPIRSAPVEQLVAVVGPVLQRYLTGDAPGA